jgi:DNA replication protein DnaC
MNGIEDILAIARKNAALSQQRLAKTKAELCPSCAPRSTAPAFVNCPFRGSVDCRIAPDLARLEERQASVQRLERGRVPTEFWPALLGDKPQRSLQAVEFVKRFLEKKEKLLAIAGNPGCGKSFGGSYAVLQLAGVFQSAPGLGRVKDESIDVDELIGASLLVLDEVGDEHSPGGYVASLERDIIRTRLHFGRPTILTTNVPLRELVERLDVRFESRLGDRYMVSKDPDQRRVR